MNEPKQREVITSCRICAGQCSLILRLDAGGRITSARGDQDNPLTQGYACIKGLHAHEALTDPDRLLQPLRRCPDGSFETVRLETALDDIAERLEKLIGRHGPQAVAGFRGTMNYSNATANRMLPDWLASIGSRAFFSTMTIDQSAKWVTFERLGGWAAGRDSFDVAEVLLLVGTNPLVSLSTFNFPLQHPVNRLREFKARGGRLIVIDPRRTETARHADVFLQPRPGEDSTLIAGLLRIILTNGWHDALFCERYVQGLDELAAAVASFTPDYVSQRAGVASQDLERAARMFACDSQRGSAASGTGPDMGPHSNLAEHLIECLNVVCGRYARAGDAVANPGVIGPRRTRTAEVIAPLRSWERSPKSRVRGLGSIFGEMMSAALPEEITQPGPGQVRALFVDGGNPASCIPDQVRTVTALRQLELLVCIEPFMTNTARLAHFVIPPKLMFERYDLPTRDYETIVTGRPYAQYAVPVSEPPPGSEVADDWYVFWAIAQRLGKQLHFDGVPLNMQQPPDTEDLLAILARNSDLPFDTIRRATAGEIFAVEPMTVAAGDPRSTARFDVMPADVSNELAAVKAQSVEVPGFTYRLIVRRMREVQNTMYRHLPGIRRRAQFNPLWLHPTDLATLGIASGSTVEIRSSAGSIRAIVEADSSLRPGVAAMSHGWGDLPEDPARIEQAGSNTGRLVDSSGWLDPINAMPRMSAIPINIQPL